MPSIFETNAVGVWLWLAVIVCRSRTARIRNIDIRHGILLFADVIFIVCLLGFTAVLVGGARRRCYITRDCRWQRKDFHGSRGHESSGMKQFPLDLGIGLCCTSSSRSVIFLIIVDLGRGCRSIRRGCTVFEELAHTPLGICLGRRWIAGLFTFSISLFLHHGIDDLAHARFRVGRTKLRSSLPVGRARCRSGLTIGRARFRTGLTIGRTTLRSILAIGRVFQVETIQELAHAFG
mmetsp:Transcript_13374/g.25393  ORF Transcript_13374/g.25393 Transcript_13374/m.25393 type:complete len:235 (+) Transcript_13374:71-775(+)